MADSGRDPAGGVGALAVRLLGPLEVSVGGRPVAVTTGRLRTLLAVLAMSAGEAVSVDRLRLAVWDADLPGDVRGTVQTYVTRLRGLLGAGLIRTSPGGYALSAAPDQVDALRFLRLLDDAAAVGEVARERGCWPRRWGCGGGCRSRAYGRAGWPRSRRRG